MKTLHKGFYVEIYSMCTSPPRSALPDGCDRHRPAQFLRFNRPVASVPTPAIVPALTPDLTPMPTSALTVLTTPSALAVSVVQDITVSATLNPVTLTSLSFSLHDSTDVTLTDTEVDLKTGKAV